LHKRGNNNDHVEVAAFCKDPTFPAAASATVTSETYGKIYIWDISKQVLFFIFLYLEFLFEH